MKSKTIIILLFCFFGILSFLLIGCPGLIDNGSNINEEKQCFYLDFEVGSSGHLNAQFNLPLGIAVNSQGYIYVVDSGNNRIQKFDSTGNFVNSFGESALLSYPADIAISSDDSIYITDKGKHRIIKYESNEFSNNVISDSDGESGSEVGQFKLPEGIDVNGSTIVVADTGNNRIQMWNGSGWEVLTITGIATFFKISDVVFDKASSDNLFIVERGFHRVIKCVKNGAVYEIAKNSTGADVILGKSNGANYIAGSEEGAFYSPRGITAYGSNFIFIADSLNNRIQQFKQIDGTFIESWKKDGFLQNSSGTDEISYPVGITIDNDRNVYVVESDKDRFKKFKHRDTKECNDKWFGISN